MQSVTRMLLLIGVTFWFLSGKTVISAGFGSWNKLPSAETQCAVQNVKLLSLLNLLCNTTQTTSLQMRDACYGCFFRAGSVTNGPTQLTSLNDCARLYIGSSEYGECSRNLQSIVDGIRVTNDATVPGYCYTGYCEFVRCIRRINSRKLIASCYRESLGNRELGTDLDRVNFYTNVTSCILAKARCSQYNPISGQLQNQVNIGKGYASWLGNPAYYYNALQFSDSGELRIISFPASTNVGDLFCSKTPSLQQTGFGTYVC